MTIQNCFFFTIYVLSQCKITSIFVSIVWIVFANFNPVLSLFCWQSSHSWVIVNYKAKVVIIYSLMFCICELRILNPMFKSKFFNTKLLFGLLVRSLIRLLFSLKLRLDVVIKAYLVYQILFIISLFFFFSSILLWILNNMIVIIVIAIFRQESK